jgi:hypothetical protein
MMEHIKPTPGRRRRQRPGHFAGDLLPITPRFSLQVVVTTLSAIWGPQAAILRHKYT